VTTTDVLRLGHAIGLAVERASPVETERLMSIMLKGLEG
jgi:hypothetical protein